ncbi:MAG TPA: hypothetical protein VGR03_15535 [Candidatus Acidoferrum sp.]|nr:hypothetical protein [Candidatus Acidoferrum sp.]
MSGSVVLLHEDHKFGTVEEQVGNVIYRIPPGEATEVPDEVMEFSDAIEYRVPVAQIILRHKGPIHGIVAVTAVKMKNQLGVEYLVDEAKEEARKLLAASCQQRFEQYLQEQKLRIQQGGQAVAPSGRNALYIEEMGISLKDHGINPVGFDQSKAPSASALASENAELKNQMSEMREQIAAIARAQKKK